MGHVGVICPNTPGHVNPMVALADALRSRGHRVTFFLSGEVPGSVTAAGFEVVLLGVSAHSAEESRNALQLLGTLKGRAALNHTLALIARGTELVLEEGPAAVRATGVTALVVDQAAAAGGTVADELGLPFATVCNALVLNHDPVVPPYFTHWRPRDVWWARVRNRVAWSGLDRKFKQILAPIQKRRRARGLSIPKSMSETWSGRIQVSQQPETFEFPRRELPKQFRFVGPLRLPGGYAAVPFPWERLDGRPLIYASLGTLQNRIAATFRTIAEACAGLDAQLVISTGNGVSPEALGELPGKPVVVSYAPQLDLLRRSALAVTHAGLNTVLDALSIGVPMVAIPVTNEQPGIAARVAWAGAGEALSHKRLSARTLRPLVARVRAEPSYRAAAERVRDSIRLGGGAPRAAELIEQSLGLGV